MTVFILEGPDALLCLFSVRLPGTVTSLQGSSLACGTHNLVDAKALGLLKFLPRNTSRSAANSTKPRTPAAVHRSVAASKTSELTLSSNSSIG